MPWPVKEAMEDDFTLPTIMLRRRRIPTVRKYFHSKAEQFLDRHSPPRPLYQQPRQNLQPATSAPQNLQAQTGKKVIPRSLKTF